MNKDNIERASTNRRGFLRGAAAVGVGATLAPYLGKAGIVGATTVPPGGEGTAAAGVDAVNPFGIADSSTVDAVIFNGGYGIDYVEFAADIFEQTHEGSTVEVSPSTLIAPELQPRFVSGDPPDIIDNSGAQSIGMATILDQLEDLTDVIDAPNLEGVTIRDTLYGGVLAPGTFEGKLAAINYALTVYAIWYSSSLFEENRWTPPTTWAEALELGAAAAEQDKYLFGWGQEAATYYQTFCIDSAIMQGGDEVRLALSNLAEGCWSLQPVQDVFAGLKAIIDAGYMQPGGAGTQFVQAQAQWSNDQSALLYPSGSWIENEMKDTDRRGFRHARRANVHRQCRFGVPGDGAALHGGRAVHRAIAGCQRRRRQGVAADHAVDGGGDELRQDEAGADGRRRARARGRLRVDGARVADRHAGGGGRGHLHPRLHRTSTAPTRSSW